VSLLEFVNIISKRDKTHGACSGDIVVSLTIEASVTSMYRGHTKPEHILYAGICGSNDQTWSLAVNLKLGVVN
jgi:hypothetical protein